MQLFFYIRVIILEASNFDEASQVYGTAKNKGRVLFLRDETTLLKLIAL